MNKSPCIISNVILLVYYEIYELFVSLRTIEATELLKVEMRKKNGIP